MLSYLTVAFLGIVIAIAAIRTPRYFPVITLLGLGIGTPSIGLGVIRAARILGFTTNPTDVSQQLIILFSFWFTIYCMVHALGLVIREGKWQKRAVAHGATGC